MARKPTNRRDRDESDFGARMMIGAGHHASIGEDLRAERESRGEELQDIAAQLRIRFIYLDAIEKGQFDSLPGPTYAIGFVRAYARYLRIDAEEMIARFKVEVAGIDAPSVQLFPEPASESHAPRGGLVFIAIMLAVAAYGGWYYLSTRDMSIVNMVPSVPSDFPGAPADDVANRPPEVVDLAPQPPDYIDPALATRLDSGSEGPAPVVAAPSGAVSQAPAPAQTAAIPAVRKLSGPARSPRAPGSEAPVAEAGPRVYGERNEDARIILRARGDSWVQIRASDDSLVMTRTLRVGDSYRVPNLGGLKLMTGNAGALDILVDNQATLSLGLFGAVRRNIALDAERLKAGTVAPN